MKETARLARNAYKKEWAKKNPDKIRKYNETYWNKKAAEYEKAINAAADAIAPEDSTPCSECGLC